MRFYVLIGVVLLVSCNSGDRKMCDCLEAGQQLNDYAARILLEEVSAEEAAQLKQLKKVQQVKCKDFQLMSGEEMLKRKAECADN
jgi:hypothetical protein